MFTSRSTMLAVRLLNDQRIAAVVEKLLDTMYTVACFFLHLFGQISK